jgi:hypothetical protein
VSHIFYLSYSRDDYSHELRQFLQALSTELRILMGMPANEQIGFLDTEGIALGEPWRDTVLNALQTSRILVPLYTPRYFMREICGREVEFFLERVRHVKRTTASPGRYIFPIVWVPPDPHNIPQSLLNIQMYDVKFPAVYREYGLRRLAVMNNTEDEYHAVLFSLASSISQAVTTSPELPPLVPAPSLDELRSAFAPVPKRVHTDSFHDRPEPTPLAATKARIFICYRRQETSWHAGWLSERMNTYFGEGSVFVDTESIEPGEDFEQAIERTLTDCEGVVVLVGKNWLHLKGQDGKLRLNDENDYVRREIATALAKGIRVIPVLVDNASMPKRDQLPDDLKTFATRNAIPTNADRFIHDTDRLMRLFKKPRG